MTHHWTENCVVIKERSHSDGAMRARVAWQESHLHSSERLPVEATQHPDQEMPPSGLCLPVHGVWCITGQKMAFSLSLSSTMSLSHLVARLLLGFSAGLPPSAVMSWWPLGLWTTSSLPSKPHCSDASPSPKPCHLTVGLSAPQEASSCQRMTSQITWCSKVKRH